MKVSLQKPLPFNQVARSSSLKRSDLEKPQNLKVLFSDIRNFLAGNLTGITRDETIAQEIINLLFCKIYDEVSTHLNSEVIFYIKNNENEKDVKKKIVKLFGSVRRTYPDVFEKNDKIELDAKGIFFVVNKLQKFAITQADRDAVGDAFEIFIGPALRGGEGQFFTPRSLVKMCVEILDPQPDESIIDPACGSGGFLIVALEYLWRKIEKEGKRKGWSKNKIDSEKRKIASENIAGIDKDSFLAKVAKAYMAIMGDGRTGIFCENSLIPTSEWNTKTKKRIKLGRFDILLTNPPFGAKIPVTGKTLLQQYDLGFKWKLRSDDKTWERTKTLLDKQPPQILFIDRCLQLLRTGGRMAIVLPEGIFGNPSDRYIIEHVLQNSRILGIISCPPETFQPSTHTKTSVLLLEKNPKLRRDYEIFMAIAEKVGHDKNGKVIYKINERGDFILDKGGKRIIDDDLPDIVDRYKKLKERKRKLDEYNHLGFVLSFSRLRDHILIPDYYNPEIGIELEKLQRSRESKLVSIRSLLEGGIISIKRGNEVGSRFYGMGEIPFVRTSDIVNWEIINDPKKCVPLEIYNRYKDRQDIRENDILFVSDGTFLIGRSAMVTKLDEKIIIQSHIRKIRVLDKSALDTFLLFYLLNTRIVKKQIEAKTFVQSTISTLGNRLYEIILPIPKSKSQRDKIVGKMKYILEQREKLRRLQSELEKAL